MLDNTVGIRYICFSDTPRHAASLAMSTTLSIIRKHILEQEQEGLRLVALDDAKDLLKLIDALTSELRNAYDVLQHGPPLQEIRDEWQVSMTGIRSVLEKVDE